ncbi:hypothetical protein [Paraburkholderia sp.]|uniref:hypothetical protein n=1 Tax=Paraburkholderia sp. TaxID=1926495 RepID=UPI0025CD9B69|nr:hypothetical protein [Paraburkholderia sp.]
MMKQYASHGILVSDKYSKIRLYAYPAFLAIIYHVADIFRIGVEFAIFAVQLLIYIYSVYLLNRVISKNVSERAGNAIAIGLGVNIFISPYIGIALTESLSVSLQIAAIAVLARAYFEVNSLSLRKMALMGLTAGIISGLALMVRPANILFMAIVIAGCVTTAFHRRETASRTMAIFLLFSIFGFSLAVAPQFVVNVHLFNSWTFMPVYHLGSLQIDFGEQYLKYGTRIANVARPMPYVNPWYHGDGAASLKWYVLHPAAGISTIAMHIFGVLDFDFLFVYIYDTDPWYRWPLFFLSQAANFFGILGIARCMRAAINRGHSSERDGARLMIVLLSVFAITWLAICSVSAVENRFALPMVAIFLPCAVASIRWLVGSKRVVSVLAMFAVYLAVAAYASTFLSGLKVVA